NPSLESCGVKKYAQRTPTIVLLPVFFIDAVNLWMTPRRVGPDVREPVRGGASGSNGSGPGSLRGPGSPFSIPPNTRRPVRLTGVVNTGTGADNGPTFSTRDGASCQPNFTISTSVGA